MMQLSDEGAARALGLALAKVVVPGDVVALSGPLGAGKTSIARGVLEGLGLEGEAPSPSFAIVQPYDPPEVDTSVLHVDLYRIESPEEVVELGLDEARDDAVLLIEWPERLPESKWVDALWLTLAFAEGGGRNLTARVPPAWENRWPLI